MAAALIPLAALILMAPALALAQDPGGGPAGGTDVSHKFEEGFEEKILGMISDGRTGTKSAEKGAPRYYDIAVIVPHDAGGSSEAAKEGIAGRLRDMGARDVFVAEALSFVLASVPVSRIHDVALHDEAAVIGDAEAPVSEHMDRARKTVNARTGDLPAVPGIPSIDGSGVTVAVIDRGINHQALNGKVIGRADCFSGLGCSVLGVDETQGINGDGAEPHGTWVAGALAAGGSKDRGIAGGVSLLDVIRADPQGGQNTSGNILRALDWAVLNGADVVNMSFGTVGSCGPISTMALAANEAADKGGVVVVGAAGNDGNRYNSVNSPACAHNAISVGGINDRKSGLKMYEDSSRGPVQGRMNRMGVEIAAPAVDLEVVGNPPDSRSREKVIGTSFAAPQVSAAAAMMLQANPLLTPVEVKAGLLLGADYRGPVPCTSAQFEQDNPGDDCSHARKPSGSRSNDGRSLGIINNVGFGILDAARAVELTSSGSSHVILDYTDAGMPLVQQYTVEVDDASEPVKIMLVWLAHHPSPGYPHVTSYVVPRTVTDMDLDVYGPGGDRIDARSAHQNTEFAIFNPAESGTYTIDVSVNGGSATPYQEYALASTLEISSRPTKIFGAGDGHTVRGSEDSFRAADVDLSGIFHDPDGDPLEYAFRYTGGPGVGEVVRYSANGDELVLDRVPNANTGAGNHTLLVYPQGGGPFSGYAITFDIEPVPDPPRLQNAHTITPDEGAVIDLDAGLYLHDPDTDVPGQGSYETVGVSGHSKRDGLFADHTMKLHHNREDGFDAVLSVSPEGTAADASDDFEITVTVDVQPKGDRPLFRGPRAATFMAGADVDYQLRVYDPDAADAGRQIVCTLHRNSGGMPAGLALNPDCTITGTPAGAGTSTVRISADTAGDEPFNGGISGARTVGFSITVYENRPPASIVNGDSLVLRYNEDWTADPLDLNAIFDDPDGDPITYSLSPESGSPSLSAFEYEFDGKTGVLEISLRPDAHTGGRAETLTVAPSDGVEQGSEFFLEVVVAPQNDRPGIRPGAPAGHTYLVGGGVAETHDIDLSGIFHDVDGDELGYFAHPPSTHLGVADYEISDDGILSIVTHPGPITGPGTAETLRISARDGIDQSDEAYVITFSAGPAAP